MKVIFLSPAASRAAGGIFQIVRTLTFTLSASPDISQTVFGLEDDFATADAGA